MIIYSLRDIIVEEKCADQSNSCEVVAFESCTSSSSNIQPSSDDRGRQNGASEGKEVGHGDRGEPPSSSDSNTVGSTDSDERRGPLNNAEVAKVGTAGVDNTGPEVGPARTSDTNIVEIAGCGDTIQPNPCSGGHAEQMGSQNRGGHDAPDRHAARGGHGSSRYHDGRSICSGRSSRGGDDGTGGRGSRGGRDGTGGRGSRGGRDGTGGRGSHGCRGYRGILSHDLDAEELCDRNSVDESQSGIELISEPASSVAVVDLVTPPTLPQRHEVYVNCLVAFTPTKEKWLMTKKLNPVFRQVGTANIIGHVYGEDFPPDVVIDDLVEVDRYTEIVPEQAIPTSLRAGETIKNMKFDPRVQMKSSADLYSHSNGSTTTRPPTQWDPATRISPLLNLLKSTGGMYVEMDRNVALDESSVACRSKFGRHCIVFNPMKPTGKYHFRLYMLCCATTWIAVIYRFHCNSDLFDRLDGVLPANQALELQQKWAESKLSFIRKLVLEVSRPLYGSNRIVNMNNYYTSVQPLRTLRLRGLYAHGTVRGPSKHFPKLDKEEASHGDLRQGVCVRTMQLLQLHGVMAILYT
ncbi:unnamed protein product [Phytophthora fragariaefolia]|uniref:Unnamed protein product n=1 Tax=Phytophthora fragariaefolia TaxID=1490495 RepID=A0A9W6Y5R2_9STRA|nr:unnamed protein product [Phytophthora fragariaefolia]